MTLRQIALFPYQPLRTPTTSHSFLYPRHNPSRQSITNNQHAGTAPPTNKTKQPRFTPLPDEKQLQVTAPCPPCIAGLACDLVRAWWWWWR